MDVLLLAAGKSSRLGALGATLPKPLVPVCGYPAIRFGLAACARAGLRKAVVNLFHHGELIRQAIGAGDGLGLEVAYSPEQELLGTGGGIAQARAQLAPGPLLVMNAKVVADIDLPAVLAAHRAISVAATMVLHEDPDPGRWGAIRVDATGRVVGILQARSPVPPEGPVRDLMFTGVHVVGPPILNRLRPVFSDVIRDAYIPALEAGEVIRAVIHPGYFAEHSTPERYLAGNLALLRRPQLLPDPPGPLTGVDPGATVSERATVEHPCRLDAGALVEDGARLFESVVCADARVCSGVRLRRTVVWPGAIATESAEDAVVTPAGTVRVAAG